jgi:hypothetical protein
MPRGGKRKGTGRPKSSVESREPTKTVRVPLSFAEKIPELLKQHQEENSVEDLKLPAKAHEECLPLEGLAWDAFEAFCLDLIARLLKPQEIYHYGTQGDNQHGIDIVADLNNGEKWVFQCKQWQRFNPSDAKKVIEQAKEFEADRYILLLSRVASVEVRKVIANNPAWEVWDVRDISQKVRDLASSSLEVARRLVRDHFHPEWQNAFLGISKLNPFVYSEDFFHSWLNANQLFNHTWKLEGRDDALKSLHEFVASSDKQIAILPGRGGIGKTRLLYEFAKTFGQPNFILWFVEEEKSITPENADTLPLHSCITVLDDAHKLEHEQDLKTLLALIRERSRNQLSEIKLILSTRPHAVSHLESLLRQGGASSTQILLMKELKELKLSDTKALARQALGSDYSHFAELLATVSKDCPLVTVIGGKLLATKGVPFSLLERDEDFQYEVLNHFEKDLTKQVSSYLEPKTCEKLLELIAAVSPFQLKNEQFQEVASEFLCIGKNELIKYVGILGKFGVILQQGTGWKITPDVLSDYILHKACINHQGYLTGYAQQVFEQFKQICPAQVLSNLAELDWRIHYKTGQETDLLSDIWRKIREDFRVSSHYGRWKILGILEESAYNQPKQTLDLVKFAIQNPATVIEPEYTSFDTHEAVLEKVPTLLHNISYTMDYLPDCCNLLWKLGKDRKDDYKSNPEHPIQILISLIQYNLYKAFQFNQVVLDSVIRWFNQTIEPEKINLLLDILDPILQKDFDANYQEGWTVFFRKFRVPKEETLKLRDQALELIISCLKSSQPRVALRALKSLEKALRTGVLATLTPEQFAHEWGSEQLKIIEIIAQFITQNENPLLHLEVIHILRWYAHHSCILAVKERTRTVINSIPDTYELKLMTVLLHKYDWNWDEDAESTHSKYEQLVEERPQRVAKEFLHKYPNAVDGIQVLNRTLEEIRDSGFQAVSYDFLEAVGEADPSYAALMCEFLMKNSNLLLASHLTPLLSKVRLDNPKLAFTFIQEALDTANLDLLRSIVCIYLGRDWASDLHLNDLNFICKLLNYPDFYVKSFAIKSLKKLAPVHSQTALDLALTIDLENCKELTRDLCQLFISDFGINLDILTNNYLEKLLDKFELIASIDDFWIERFLVYTSQRIPTSVIQLLVKRLKQDPSRVKQNMQPYKRYEALPYGELKYKFNLTEDGNSKEVLRAIRDLSLEENTTSAFDFYLSKLFQIILLGSTSLCLSILDEWVSSGKTEKIQAVSLLLSGMPQTFAFTQVKFLENLLEQAYELGDECYEATSNNLFNALMMGSRGGTIGQPCQKDVDIRDQSSAIASQLLIGSPAHKFYSSLAKYAEANIARQIALGEARME